MKHLATSDTALNLIAQTPSAFQFFSLIPIIDRIRILLSASSSFISYRRRARSYANRNSRESGGIKKKFGTFDELRSVAPVLTGEN